MGNRTRASEKLRKVPKWSPKSERTTWNPVLLVGPQRNPIEHDFYVITSLHDIGLSSLTQASTQHSYLRSYITEPERLPNLKKVLQKEECSHVRVDVCLVECPARDAREY